MTAIEIIIPDTGEVRARWPGSRSLGSKFRVAEIPFDLLKNNWSSFVDSLGPVFQKNTKFGDFKIDEITFSISISAEGKFQLIAGAAVGAEASFQVKLKKE